MSTILFTKNTDYSKRNLTNVQITRYGVLNYIESDGNSWIDTEFTGYRDVRSDTPGIIPNDLPSIEITFETGSEKINKSIFSSLNSNCFLLSKVDVDRLQSNCKGADFSTIYKGKKTTVKIGAVKSFMDDRLLYDNTDGKKQYRINAYPNNLMLFYDSDIKSTHNQYTSSSTVITTGIKIYDFKSYSGNRLIKHLVPYRKKDGTICMLDLVSGEFHLNKGTGKFTGV